MYTTCQFFALQTFPLMLQALWQIRRALFFYVSEEREAGSNGAHLLFSVGHWDGVITLIDLAFVCGLPTLLD